MKKVRDLFKINTGGLDDVFAPQAKGPTKEAMAVEEKFERFRMKGAAWRREAASCEKFRNGIQWTEAQIKELERKRQAPIVVNLIAPSVDQLKAMVTSNNPRFNGLPREGSDRQTAMLFSDIFAHIWDFNRGNRILRLGVDNYSVRGMGYLMAWWDPQADFGKGEVILEAPNPMNVFPDPNSECPFFSDAESVMIVQDYTGEQVQRNMRIGRDFLKRCHTAPDDINTYFVDTDTPQIDPINQTEEEKYRVIDAYSMQLRPYCHYQYQEYEHNIPEESASEYHTTPVLRVQTTDLRDEHGGGVEYVIEDDEIGQWSEMMRRLGEVFHFVQTQDPQTGEMVEQPVPGPAAGEDAIRELRITPATIGEMLAQGVMSKKDYSKTEIYRRLLVGGQMYSKGWTGLTCYPVVPIPNRHNRNPFPISDITLSRDLQRELNKIRSLILTHAANTASVKLGIPKGSVKKADVEREMEKSGVSVFEYDAMEGAAPHFMYPPQLPSHFYQSEEKIRESIYEIFGIYPFMSGGEQGHSTSSGILIMDEFAQRRIAAKRSDIEESLNMLGKVVVQLVQLYYTETKTIRIVQPSGRYNEIDINSPVYDQFSQRLLHRINDVTLGRYDVVVASGSTLPTNRITRLEYFMQLYQQQLIDQYEVLKNVDEVDVEGVMERMGLLHQLQGQIQQMAEQIKALEGDLQTADRETVGARKRVEVEKFKAQLAQMSASITAALEVGKEKEMSNFREGLREETRGSASPRVLDQTTTQQVNQI